MPDRSISTRDPIAPRSGTATTVPQTTSRDISSRDAIAPRDTGGRTVTFDRTVPTKGPTQFELNEINRRILNYTGSKTLADYIGKPSSNIQANDSTGDGKLPIYGTGNPFDILGDAFLRAFGGQTYSPPRESERTVIESAGGGTNIGLILILGGIGFAVYWFYLRKKG